MYSIPAIYCTILVTRIGRRSAETQRGSNEAYKKSSTSRANLFLLIFHICYSDVGFELVSTKN
jgi:hypothetical protein